MEELIRDRFVEKKIIGLKSFIVHHYISSKILKKFKNHFFNYKIKKKIDFSSDLKRFQSQTYFKINLF